MQDLGCMGREPSPLIHRRELEEVLFALDDPLTRGLLVLGGAGSGKTSLLRLVEHRLELSEREAFFVSLKGLGPPGEVAARVIAAIERSRFSDAIAGERTIRSSAGAEPLANAAQILRRAGRQLRSPVLLLDALDESDYPLGAASAVEELSTLLDGWKFVVASRRAEIGRLGRTSQFYVIELGPLDDDETRNLLQALEPPLPAAAVHQITNLAGGNPLLVRLLAEWMRSGAALSAIRELPRDNVLGAVVSDAIDRSPEPREAAALLELLALANREDRIASLATVSGQPPSRIRGLLGGSPLVTMRVSDGTVRLIHPAVRHAILARRILERPFSLSDLRFGAEAAEQDDLLTKSYVRRPSLAAILDQEHTIVVGDRGSGKSAIFRTLLERRQASNENERLLCPVTDPADLLHRVISDDAEFDAETLKAAWLVVVASVIASSVPSSAPKPLRKTALALRVAFGREPKKPSRGGRVIRAAIRPLAGTTLKFAVGPANLEAKLPAGSLKPGGATVDVEAFLQDADAYFSASGVRAVALLDRIDEAFKYDRKRQEALIQGLFLAEGRISLLKSIVLVVFVRTDLFELYDIQEKTKLVSRTLVLEWSEEDWLRLLVTRVLVNPQVQPIADALKYSKDQDELRRPLESIFPAELEGQPVERWLIDSLRNGNGDISPRSAVLLLHLAREKSRDSEAPVTTLPLFSADAVELAMTRLSELSVSEVVDDFKVACTFVRNCKAGKLETFALTDVESLFDPEEGTVAAQVASLERLGFLTRIVVDGEVGPEPRFRIPNLYTRCWNSA